jgi:hypothetical protein
MPRGPGELSRRGLAHAVRRFLESARTTRHDIELLQNRFAASFEQVCHRLTTLQRPDAAGIPFHFLRVDVAGNISKRISLSGLRLARHGGACAVLNVHTCFMSPGVIHRQVARMPNGDTFLNIARTVRKTGMGHTASGPCYYGILLGCDVMHAKEIVYSDGIDLQNEQSIVPIGISCRLCERQDCRHRAAATVLDSIRDPGADSPRHRAHPTV